MKDTQQNIFWEILMTDFFANDAQDEETFINHVGKRNCSENFRI